jgi:hypothetical protein
MKVLPEIPSSAEGEFASSNPAQPALGPPTARQLTAREHCNYPRYRKPMSRHKQFRPPQASLQERTIGQNENCDVAFSALQPKKKVPKKRLVKMMEIVGRQTQRKANVERISRHEK